MPHESVYESRDTFFNVKRAAKILKGISKSLEVVCEILERSRRYIHTKKTRGQAPRAANYAREDSATTTRQDTRSGATSCEPTQRTANGFLG